MWLHAIHSYSNIIYHSPIHSREFSMNQVEQDKNQTPTETAAESERRAWVTPTFDQVALKDALGGPYSPLGPADGTNGSS
jgi:hypothetical protein